MSFLRHKKIYQSDGLKRELNCSFHSLTDHRSDESSTGYSFMSCSPAELMSASPASNSFSLNPCCYKALSSQPQLSLFLAVSTEGSTPFRHLFFQSVKRRNALTDGGSVPGSRHGFGKGRFAVRCGVYQYRSRQKCATQRLASSRQCYRVLMLVGALTSRLIADSKAA